MEIESVNFSSCKALFRQALPKDKGRLATVTVTATSVLLGVWLWNFLFQQESLYQRSKKFVFRIGKKIPFVKGKIDEEIRKVTDSFEKSAIKRYSSVPFVLQLKEKGMDPDAILKELEANLHLGDYDWKGGRVSGAVYYQSDELRALLAAVYKLTAYSNPLHLDIFPGINKMEAEVVAMANRLFHGSSTACGTMTSGGTESIMMACKAYRDYARDVRGVEKPEMIIPRTAHTAFDKAAAYLNIFIRRVDIDPLTTCVVMKKVQKAINSNTIMVVGSAPNFPYGTMDNIESLAALGKKYDIPVHVDCCLGGFLSVFMENAGFSVPPFDFSLSGVTSISADTHKYGFAPKGSSVILYSHPKYRNYQYTVTVDWPGGVYGSPSVGGSRAGGVIATCWATMMYFGLEGYVEATRKIINTTQYVEKELRRIKDIFIFGKPMTSVIAIGSKNFHIYQLSEKLNEKGWSVNPLQFPPGIHFCITHMHTQEGVAERLVKDVTDIVADLMKNPSQDVKGEMAIYGMSQAVVDRTIIEDFTRIYIDTMYYTPKIASENKATTSKGTALNGYSTQ